MSKLDIFMSKAKAYAVGVAAAGKKNAPTLMTGGSIILGWTAVYIFWKQSKKAEAKIQAEEQKLDDATDSDIPPDERPKLGVKDKAIIYLQYCWLALLLGVGSSGLAIGANKLQLDRLAEMYVLTQFMNDKNEKQQNLIEKLRGELGEKKFKQMSDEIRDDKFPKEEILEEVKNSTPGEGKTKFIDVVTGKTFSNEIKDVLNGIARFNEEIKEQRKNELKKRLGDAFFAAEMPWGTGDDSFPTVYSHLDLERFLRYIGEINNKTEARLGEVLEFQYFGGGDPIKPSQILEYKNFVDPDSGLPVVCYIDYADLLAPSSELMERNMV